MEQDRARQGPGRTYQRLGRPKGHRASGPFRRLLRKTTRVSRYVAAVTMAGLAMLVAHATGLIGGQRSVAIAPVLLFGAFVLLGELRPIRVQRQDEEEEVLTSTTWTFAILLCAGPAAAMVVRALVSLVPVLLRRKEWWKGTFNASQYTLSLAASAAVLRVANLPHSAHLAFRTADLPVILAAGAVFFGVNNVITGTALALAQDAPIRSYLRHDLAFQATTAGELLALAPIAVVCAERSLWLIPLFALPMVAVYGSASVSLEKHQALHDALTNLPNRRLFRDRTQQAVAAARRTDVALAVMI